MLVFRIICAFFMAWAMNWAMMRPEAALLREEYPEFVLMAPFVGAFAGFNNLAKRQGWGGFVAVANGIWTGVYCLGLALILYVFVKLLQVPQSGSFDTALLLRQMGEHSADLIDGLANPAIIAVILSACLIVGLLTEVIHWALVRLRRMRGVKDRNMRRMQRPSMY